MLLSVLVQQARKFVLLDKELKGKIVLQYSMQYLMQYYILSNMLIVFQMLT